jgi:hypothetical protein
MSILPPGYGSAALSLKDASTFLRLILAALCFALAAPASAAGAPVSVRFGKAISAPVSGRLLVFAKRVEEGAKPEEAVDPTVFDPRRVAVAARDVEGIASGAIVAIDTETGAFPSAFSALPPGTYRFQALLDRNRNHAYSGRGAGDIISAVVEGRLPGPVPALTLSSILADGGAERSTPQVQSIDFISPALTRFWGRPILMRGWIALPPGYGRGDRSYPVLYNIGGFGSDYRSAFRGAKDARAGMDSGRLPQMIWVELDESSAAGPHLFVDSVNNGPWGTALTEELIPWLERRYRMDGAPNGRLLTGHSSGGWASLWLQTRYPELFGGTWSTSPDPVDFTDFVGVDLYDPAANMYVARDGTPRPFIRDQGKTLASMADSARFEHVIGAYGGQFASFDWVYSPRGPDGRPLPLFDRRTGAVDPEVARYWRENYDISLRMRRMWPAIGPRLHGKLHVIVGTEDTFFLEGAVRKLEATLKGLGARPSFRYLEGRTHMDLFERGGDELALLRDIAWEAYGVARPKALRPAGRKKASSKKKP